MATLLSFSHSHLIKHLLRTCLVLWMMQICQVDAEIWTCWGAWWRSSPNCGMTDSGHPGPYLHDFLAPIQYIDTTGASEFDWSHYGRVYCNLRFGGNFMAGSLGSLYLTKGRSKFHPTTTKLFLLLCFINVWREIVKRVVKMMLFWHLLANTMINPSTTLRLIENDLAKTIICPWIS